MTKPILIALTITVILFIAPIASGSFSGSIQTAYADPKQACPEGTTLDPSTKQCGTEPTCSTGTYNPASNLCEATLTSSPSCSIGTYNPTTNVCEATIPSVANCSIGSLNPDTDLCEVSPEHGKIPLCHVAGKNGKTVEISVNIESLEAHLMHGDTVGSC